MAKLNCFSVLVGKKKKSKESSHPIEANKGHGTLQVKLKHLVNSYKVSSTDAASFNLSVPFRIQENSTCQVKVLREEKTIRVEATEAAYEGEDEHEENSSMKRDFSDFDLQSQIQNNGEKAVLAMERNNSPYDSINTEMNNKMNDGSERDEIIEGGHVSDPGIGRKVFCSSPKLKRSCSNLETRDLLPRIANELKKISGSPRGEVNEIQSSPLSAITSCSADKVMLKRRSSSQVLPSRSRRLWWKLFLWSHRNLHKPVAKPKLLSVQIGSNQKGGYSSDTLEPSRVLDNKGKAIDSNNLKSPDSFSSESKINISNNQNWDNFHEISNLWPGNQWVAFSAESSSSPLARVDEWVTNLDTHFEVPLDDGDVGDEGEIGESVVYQHSSEIGESPRKNSLATRRSNLTEEVLQANKVVQSLNSFSTVAHIAGMGLKAIPTISPFSVLRTVNLSGNYIVHITSGSLPKSLHTLNLSRNKIATIEGLRELTRLRVLDLSYNRISRIGHGLSNCTVIKVLYLAGNKISDVEGLHRLLKLTVLDLSFNKITTAKALGQLVANYHSLLALNLLGNPIQSHISEDQLRKAVSSLLPQLAYLNKQPIKPQRGREMVKDSVAKAALGHSGWNSMRKVSKRVSHGSTSVKGRSTEGAALKSHHHKSKSSQRHSPSTRK
ncbi:uncharacterized protein LOC143848471 isoform X2 [Tasmannia lanceolata]|uniref:uncharacterized protein LOC143848471 isoform X2 n=1 Tax=Tasmannia lanceolata TaxID=3420 RepID=UPI0040639107